jgi:hypothetical protein
MIFGPIPEHILMFNLNGSLVRYADRFCYVGILFQSTERNIFAANYIEKADIARGIGYSVFRTEAYIGNLPPKEGRLLYMVCIDPHLISGADVIVDVNDPMLAELEKAQLSYLRRLLGLGTRAIRVPLFTELGLIPLRYQRLIIALRYLRYLVGLAHDHYTWLALQDSYRLFLDDKQGYWMDLVYALGRLPVPIHLPALTELTSGKCEALGKSVYTAAMKHLEHQVAKSPRLYLLRDCLEPVKDEPPRPITTRLRHHMTLVVNSRHRKALTKDYCLAIIVLRLSA